MHGFDPYGDLSVVITYSLSLLVIFLPSLLSCFMFFGYSNFLSKFYIMLNEHDRDQLLENLTK